MFLTTTASLGISGVYLAAAIREDEAAHTFALVYALVIVALYLIHRWQMRREP